MTSKCQSTAWVSLFVSSLGFVVTTLPSETCADATLGLAASAMAVERLAQDSPSAQSTFNVSDATNAIFDILSTTPGIGVTVQLPNGAVVDETTVATIGGEAQRGDVEPGGSGPLIFPTGQAGQHITFTIPNPLSGTWTLGFSQPPGNTEEIAVVTQLLLNSPTMVGMLVLPGEIVFGQAVTLTLAAYSLNQPVTNGTVNAQLVSPTGAAQVLTLLDDGQGADSNVGDGLYSAALIPTETGEHTVLATFAGTTPGGVSVTRQAAARFTVVPPSAALLGTVTTQTVDSNGNGLIDQLVLDVGVKVLIAGDFLISATLKASNGSTIQSSVRATESVGFTMISVAFTAEQVIQGLGVDGPYQIGPVEITFLESSGAVPADRLENAGQTPAFALTDFESPAIRLTGNAMAIGIDSNGNGLVDTLHVFLGVDLRDAAVYRWSGRLVDPQGTEIGFAIGGGTLAAGVTQIALDFAGCPIGQNNVPGPYAVQGFLMFGASASLTAPGTVVSANFQARQFECAPPNTPPVAQCQDVIVPTASGVCTASASIDNGSFDPDGGAIVLAQVPEGPYGVGSTAVALTVTDDQGAFDSCMGDVTVVDQQQPDIGSCPASVAIDASSAGGAAVTYVTPTANDNCSVCVSCVPAAGSTFVLGNTTVVCSAEDAAGNTAACTLDVTVRAPRVVKQDVISQLFSLQATVTNRNDGRKFQNAIRHLNNSVDPGLWMDASHPQVKGGKKVFREEKAAVFRLLQLVKASHSSLPVAELRAFIDRIVLADRVAALVAISDAVARNGNPNKLAAANNQVATGDLQAQGKPNHAIDHYKHAWALALAA